MEDFEPKIAAFLCNWCAYAGADLAGVSRLQYPAGIRAIRVMCSGRVEPAFIIKALKQGCDGVLVAGWHFGDCHYLEGNVQAEKKIRATQKLLEIAGIGKERLHLAWISSAEAQRFVEIVVNITAVVNSLGKLDSAALALELDAAEMTLDGETVRWLVGKEVKITSEGDVYGRKWDPERFESVLDTVMTREYHKNRICLAIKAGCTCIEDIGTKIGLDLEMISHLLADLEKTGKVKFRGMKDRIPVFETV
jgi:F420-non-reducing hydrogenase iron-sulfur subunit